MRKPFAVALPRYNLNLWWRNITDFYIILRRELQYFEQITPEELDISEKTGQGIVHTNKLFPVNQLNNKLTKINTPQKIRENFILFSI